MLGLQGAYTRCLRLDLAATIQQNLTSYSADWESEQLWICFQAVAQVLGKKLAEGAAIQELHPIFLTGSLI